MPVEEEEETWGAGVLMGLARARKEVHSSGTYWGLKGHPGGRYFEVLEEEPPGGGIPKLQTKSAGRAPIPPFHFQEMSGEIHRVPEARPISSLLSFAEETSCMGP